MKKPVFVFLAGILLTACGGVNAPQNNVITNSTNTLMNSALQTSSNHANSSNSSDGSANASGVNKPIIPASPTASTSGPKRITFGAGQSAGNESVSLAAGESREFIFGAKNGQILMIDADSKDLEISLIKGRDSAQMKEPGHYDSTLLADGDFVFRVKNTSNREVRSSIKVIISHTDISNH